MSYVLEHMGQNIWRGKFNTFPDDVAIHGISARLGGVSQTPYASLNMGLHVGDDPAAVRENRQRFLAMLGLKAARICTPEQVHGDVIDRVGTAEMGRGALEYADAIKGCDALITNEPGVPLMLCFADCTPILFIDPVHHAVGIAHGGWKGTVSRIAAKTVQRLADEFGTQPEDLLVGIGPSIGPECFEVGEEVADAFRDTFGAYEQVIISYGDNLPDGERPRPHVNLWEANRVQLLEAGVPAANIDVAGVCTCCQNKWYFSYRAEQGRTGRLAAVIALQEY